MATSISDLLQSDTQVRTFQMQVWRHGAWITIPVEQAQANVSVSRAGQVTVHVGEDVNDEERSKLYEGERIRMYRGVEGAAPIRCWTGFVDTREPTEAVGNVSRQFVITDYAKELFDSLVIDGTTYDGMAPNAAIADAIQKAINSGQFQPFSDTGSVLSSTASYNNATGNPFLYIPDLFNDDGSAFKLPQGAIGSFTNPQGGSGLPYFVVPPASGASYVAWEMPSNNIIGSTMTIPGMTLASATSFPPASGSYFCDFFNGILYFNPADSGRQVSFSASYYTSPLFSFPAGTKVGDVVSTILDKTGCRWWVDGTGKITARYVNVTRAPKRILPRSAYISNGVEINRDRRNVIMCLGWDGNCGGLLAAKAVNWDDINNAPPVGLGKRQYLIIQDQTWKTQFAVNKAALWALQSVSRRGKIVAISLIDDPTLSLDDVICFEATVPEVSPGDFFYIESLGWTVGVSGSKYQALANISGTLLPGRGTFYYGAVTGVTAYGSMDVSTDVRPIFNCFLTTGGNNVGGSYNSTFSLAADLTLHFTIGGANVIESIDLYGSDGSHIVAESHVARSANLTLALSLPLGSLVAGVLYVVNLTSRDVNGQVGVYRDFVVARP